MQTTRSWTIAVLSMMSVLVSACGGAGDDEAGSLTTFSIVPSTITVTGPIGFCPGSGSIGKIFVYGGTAPYRIDNTVPDFVSVDRNTVGERGGSFNVTSLGQGCLVPGQIVVVDALDRQVTLEITLEKGE